MPEPTGRPSRPDSMSLLTGLLTETLDPGYAQVAARKKDAARDQEHGGHEKRPWWAGGSPLVVIGIASMALVLVVAAIQVRRSAPAVEKERTDLIQRIQTAEAGAAADEKSIETIRGELQQAQSAALGPSTDAGRKFAALSVGTGAVAVTGPGVEVTLNDASSSQSPNGGDMRQTTNADAGRVLDVDIQHAANGLWAAGAEAISINGQRLSALSAIRTAGSAILVDYRPLTPPYKIDAIGDPRTLAAKFSETTDGRYLFGIKAAYGVGFDVAGKSDLSLPAAPQLEVPDAVPVP